MSQPDESHGCPYCGDEQPRRVACAIREPEPDLTCPGCEGDGLCHYDDALPGEPCEWCLGAGTYVRPAPTATEQRERVRRLEAALRQIDAETSGRQLDLFSRLNGTRP